MQEEGERRRCAGKRRGTVLCRADGTGEATCVYACLSRRQSLLYQKRPLYKKTVNRIKVAQCGLLRGARAIHKFT